MTDAEAVEEDGASSPRSFWTASAASQIARRGKSSALNTQMIAPECSGDAR